MALPRRQLVILQQSPFCNIDCTYCYLPDRLNKQRMSFETMERIYQAVFESEQIRDPISFLWHAGEPLAVGHDYFEEAFKLSDRVNQNYNRRFFHNIQTNATLIDERWIELFKEHDVIIGVSIDGPAFIHDYQRITRGGKGTHENVMRGIRLLQEGGIPFETISVLTRHGLDYPDEMFDFFVDNGIKGIAFNIDEAEGVNTQSSYEQQDAPVLYKRFMRRFLERMAENPGVIRVREFYSMFPFITAPGVSMGEGEGFNNTNVPLQLLTIDYRGNYNTFCPELSGTPSLDYNNFMMGNVYTDPIDRIFDNPTYQKVADEVQRGVDLCRSTCQYWGLCGGGAPSNKFFEHGRFDVSETMHCRIHVQALADTIADFLEDTLETSS